MTAADPDLDSAAQQLLTAHVGKVNVIFRLTVENPLNIALNAFKRFFARQMTVNICKAPRPVHLNITCKRSLLRVLAWNDYFPEAVLPCTRGYRQNAARRTKLARQTKLPDKDIFIQIGFQLTRARKHRNGDRQIELRSLFPQVGRRKINNGALRRKLKRAVAQRRAHTLLCLFNGCVGQPDNIKRRQTV